MGKTMTIEAADGHRFDAYRAEPQGPARGGLVVVQEIFGVNSHIRSLCDGFAADGFLAIAPALFDRAQRGVELGYDDADVAKGREIRSRVPWDAAMQDVQATVAALAPAGRIGIVGYCWGGSIAWLAAARIPGLAGAVGYYGGAIAEFAGERIRTTTMLHFGARDPLIPAADVDKIRKAHSDITIHVYEDADHGFNCDQRRHHHEPSARLARERTLLFFRNRLEA